ncbi:hypothetical protein AB0F13_25045 [Streptomyces sp. NPDC026206]|uniref:hypothetical protein n=1 Tax=Streptomyces sp. NPDC026206 TaxID=3157089 RepID=UPI00340E0764
MLARGHRLDLRIFRDMVADEHQPTQSRTTLSPQTVAGYDFAAQFALGLRLPDLCFAWHTDPQGLDGVTRRLWVATADASSWAAVDETDDGDEKSFTVWQQGRRRLWDEVATAWDWYTAEGYPEPGRFGMTISPDGAHQPWLDGPGNLVL